MECNAIGAQREQDSSAVNGREPIQVLQFQRSPYTTRRALHRSPGKSSMGCCASVLSTSSRLPGTKAGRFSRGPSIGSSTSRVGSFARRMLRGSAKPARTHGWAAPSPKFVFGNSEKEGTTTRRRRSNCCGGIRARDGSTSTIELRGDAAHAEPVTIRESDQSTLSRRPSISP